jgi:hypothetical protein
MARQKKLTRKRRRTFLDALAKHGNVSQAALSAGMGRTQLYKRRAELRDFAEEWEDAEARYVDTCRTIADRRATVGEEVVIRTTSTETDDKGRVVAMKTTEETRLYKSDRLLAQLLDRRHPEYRAAAARRELSGIGGKPIPVTPIAADATPEEAAAAYLELVAKA